MERATSLRVGRFQVRAPVDKFFRFLQTLQDFLLLGFASRSIKLAYQRRSRREVQLQCCWRQFIFRSLFGIYRRRAGVGCGTTLLSLRRRRRILSPGGQVCRRAHDREHTDGKNNRGKAPVTVHAHPPECSHAPPSRNGGQLPRQGTAAIAPWSRRLAVPGSCNTWFALRSTSRIINHLAMKADLLPPKSRAAPQIRLRGGRQSSGQWYLSSKSELLQDLPRSAATLASLRNVFTSRPMLVNFPPAPEFAFALRHFTTGSTICDAMPGEQYT